MSQDHAHHSDVTLAHHYVSRSLHDWKTRADASPSRTADTPERTRPRDMGRGEERSGRDVPSRGQTGPGDVRIRYPFPAIHPIRVRLPQGAPQTVSASVTINPCARLRTISPDGPMIVYSLELGESLWRCTDPIAVLRWAAAVAAEGEVGPSVGAQLGQPSSHVV